MREVALGGWTPPEKIFRSKSTNQSSKRDERLPDCALRSADFLRWCLSSERNLTHNLFFLFPIGLVLIRFILSMRRRTVQPEIRSFVSVPRSPVKPFDRGKTKSANFTKNRNCFEECNVFGNGKCELSAINIFKRGETKVQIFGKEKCKTHRQVQRN